MLLRHFWDDDPRRFSSLNSNKQARFQLFFTKYGEELARYGLSRRQANDSIRAAIVMRTLPPALAEQLFLSQLLTLTRLHDPSQRAELAQLAIAGDWSVRKLHDAVDALRAGLPLDGDPTQPGVQVPKAAVTEKPPAPGRLVTRAEKLAVDVEVWAKQWTQVDASGLRTVQRARLAKAADALEAQVAELRRVIG